MKYNQLTAGKNRRAIRRGRGISAGRGKTAGRGTKGQGARKSSHVRSGFEGGQIPLSMRLPHLRGFKSRNQPRKVVYTAQLENLRLTKITNSALFEAGILADQHAAAKLIYKGEIKSKKIVELQAASAAAQKALINAGGSFTAVARLPRPAKKTAAR